MKPIAHPSLCLALACALIPGAAASAAPAPADPDLVLERMILVLKRDPADQARLDRFLAELQDPASAAYHQWLTPGQFGRLFGPPPGELARVIGWLTAQGFRVDEVARSGMAVTFSGSAGKVRRAFRAPLYLYADAEGEYVGSQAEPQLPPELADRAEGLLSLGGRRRRAMNTGFVPAPRGPSFSMFGLHLLAPGDFAAIYNTAPLYRAGIDGSGVDIAVIGRSRPSAEDPRAFRAFFQLPDNPPALVINGPDPGSLGGAEDGEADLDMEWSGAVAPMARIHLVVSKSTAATDGVDLSAQYAVEQDLAGIITVSFGACEDELGQPGCAFYRNLWDQAAAQGISVVVAAGDSGAAACTLASAWRGGAQGVSGLASPPSCVAAGGTMFAWGTCGGWGGSNRADHSSAKGYINEAAWNESGNPLFGFGIWAGGGGVSGRCARPAWQQAPGVPEGGQRDLPDLALAAGSWNGYLIQTGGWPNSVGGTSAAAPSLAGILALVSQHAGGRLGNPNPELYRLGQVQYGGNGAKVFHDVTQGNTNVPGTSGYACTPGYDLATGLGSVDAQTLVQAWNQ